MATLSAKIFKHHKKADGTYNVKICLCHKRDRVYFDTEHYVVDKQLKKDLSIKDPFINSILSDKLKTYRKYLSDLEDRVNGFTAENLKQYLLGKDLKIDFLKFSQTHIELLDANKQGKHAANYRTVKNHISDFVGSASLSIEMISPSFIADFEKYLRGPKTMTRTDQFGRLIISNGKPLGDASVHNYLRDFQGIFSAAIAFYNKPYLGLIPIKFNPFENYKIVEAPETEKRNIEVENIIKIRDCEVVKGGRAELARNLSMLSFYLCGMNAVDLYKREYRIKNGRIEYNRSKTKNKRKDKAFISIKIPPEAKELIDFAAHLPERYSSIDNLNHALSKGMAILSEKTEIPDLEFYKLRHSFGNQARNTCRMSKDDVALALNHVDHGRKTTDIYVAKDWRILDEVQEAVLNLYRPTLSKSFNKSPVVKFLFEQINLPILV